MSTPTPNKSAKRFSLASFTRSFQSNPTTSETPPRRRLEKTQSMYIKPTNPPLIPSAASQAPRQSFQEELPKKSHTQHIKKTIRRSLSVIMYANPSSSAQENQKSHLVPVLVTPNVADPMILMEEKKKEQDPVKPKKNILEYDNTVMIEPMDGKDQVLILWQGYGYTLENSAQPSSCRTSSSSDDSDMPPTPTEPPSSPSVPHLDSYDRDRWATYKGLIHPLHLFDLNEDTCWNALTVAELRKYYDNYGSMMLKQREWRQQQQVLQYHPIII